MKRFRIPRALLATWAVMFGSILGIYTGLAQSPPPYPTPNGSQVQPTEVQSLKLKVAQKDAIIAQQASQSLHQQAQMADQQAQSALTTLQKLAEDIKKEQGWGADVSFEPNQLTFTKAPEHMGDKPKPMPDPTAKPAAAPPASKP